MCVPQHLMSGWDQRRNASHHRRPSLGYRGQFSKLRKRARARPQRKPLVARLDRHVSLVMLVFAMMAIIRHRANLLAASQRHIALVMRSRVHRLADPRTAPHRRTLGTTTHSACLRHRLVRLASSTPSKCTTILSEEKNATVMLAKDWGCLNRSARAFLRWASVRMMLRKLCQITK